MVSGSARLRVLAVLAAGALGAVVVGAPRPSHAQDTVLQASVDRPVVRDNESFTYTIRAEGAVRGEPELAPLKEQFDVLGSASEKRVGIINGRTSQVTTWTYQLMPKAAGEFELPPVRIDAAQTNPVRLRVTAPDTSSKAPSDIFMELDAQPSTVYAQSQVIFTLRLFVGVATGRATLTQPEVTGGEAIVEKLGEDATYQTERAGRAFLVRERRYAVFPQAAGTLTIGPATFEAMVIPDRGFSRVGRFRSGSIDVQVQPAVPPPPEFPDAAWLPAQRVTLTDKWNDESSDLPVGIPRTREVAIEADGLLETQLPELTLPEQPGIRQYADQPELVREITPQGFKAARRVSMAVIAQKPGDVALPKIELPWFNVATQGWEVASLPERTLRVTPSSEVAPAAPEPDVATAAAPAGAPASGAWPAVSALLALGWAVTALLWWRSSRAGGGGAPRTRSARAGFRGAQTGRTQSAARSRGRVRRERRGRRAARAARVGRRAVSGRAAAQPRRARIRAKRCACAGDSRSRSAHLQCSARSVGWAGFAGCARRPRRKSQFRKSANGRAAAAALPLSRRGAELRGRSAFASRL